MTKRIRTTLAALLIAFAIAFSANQLGGFTGMSSDTAGGIKIMASLRAELLAGLGAGVA